MTSAHSPFKPWEDGLKKWISEKKISSKDLSSIVGLNTLTRIWLEGAALTAIDDWQSFAECWHDKLLQKCLEVTTNRLKNGECPGSPENWRFKPVPEISIQNKSLEKCLEKAIAQLACDKRPGWVDWANQVPVASGIVDRYTDKKRAIDLVKRIASEKFQFIELKTGSDNPFYAAHELLGYFAFYLFARNSSKQLPRNRSPQPELLSAKRIELIVLAPVSFYNFPKWDERRARIQMAYDKLANKFSKGAFEVKFEFQTLDEMFPPGAQQNELKKQASTNFAEEWSGIWK